jgi:lipopolysaccharide biosynthesis glycosyltransferase
MGMSAADQASLCAQSPAIRIVALTEAAKAWLDAFALHGFRHVSHAAYAKLQLHRLLPELDRVIYLDTDTLVLGDLAELHACDLGANLVGATWTAYQREEGQQRLGLNGRYFNSGVLLCALDKWREQAIETRFIEWYRLNHMRMKFNDQEVLNGVFDTCNLEIGKRWNVSHLELFRVGNQAEVSLKETAILHFNGPHKPWHADYEAQVILNKALFLPIKAYLQRLNARIASSAHPVSAAIT